MTEVREYKIILPENLRNMTHQSLLLSISERLFLDSVTTYCDV
jgi:hypothetical protein